jgi:hypothetical protein
MVLVDYLYATGSIPSGLNLAVTGDVEVEPGAKIDLDGRGYGFGNGRGTGSPGTLTLGGGGAGHGGNGGSGSGTTGSVGYVSGGAAFDSTIKPADLGGCGGAGTDGPGGTGGGAGRLQVDGTLKLDGSISANGDAGASNRSGGGAGGSVWIIAGTILGQGSISANGGTGEPPHGGGGGGGRVALYFSTNNFSGAISAQGGNGFQRGGTGTIYTESQDLAVRQLLVQNAQGTGAATPLTLANGADVLVTGAATVSAASSMVANNFSLASGSRLLSQGQKSISITASNVVIETGASIDLNGAGDAARQGSGAGGTYGSSSVTYGGGAGHGGYGGSGGYPTASAFGGSSYGMPTQPTTWGSGGGGNLYGTNVGGAGGGELRLNVSRELEINGSISANGLTGTAAGGGGGSGGSLWLSAGSLSGAGSISVNGGAGGMPTGGGGAGGRIVIDTPTNLFAGVLAATGGTGTNNGGAGTVYYGPQGGVPRLVIDNGGLKGTNTPATISGVALTIIGGARATFGDQVFSSLFIGSNSAAVVPSYQKPSTRSFNVQGDMIIEATGRIDADGAGYPSGSGISAGAGRSAYSGNFYYGGGGGHAGYGGAGSIVAAFGGMAYDNALDPGFPGSGGGGSSYYTGGSGGGAIRILVEGMAVIDGDLTANGTPAQAAYAGGGAGGTINLTTTELTGSGRILANGGSGFLPYGGGGSGGCIKLQFTAPRTNTFSGLIAAMGGAGYSPGAAGTVAIRQYTSNLPIDLFVGNAEPNATNTVLNGLISTVNLRLAPGARVALGSGLQAFSSLLVQSNATLITSPYPSGTSLRVNGNATIEQGGRIFADGTGYPGNNGPGRGLYGGTTNSGGGGFGGAGGSGANVYSPGGKGAPGGPANGSALASYGTVAWGSGGGTYYNNTNGGAGGGYIGMWVTGTLLVDGMISANGSSPYIPAGYLPGGGSGGAVFLSAGTLTGTGAISANGGNSFPGCGGGGGGRISISCTSNRFTGTISAFGGLGAQNGGAGTIYLKELRSGSEQLLMANGGNTGTNTPLAESGNFHLSIRDGAEGMIASQVSVRSMHIASNGVLAMATTPLTVVNDAILEPGGRITADGFATGTAGEGYYSSTSVPRGGGGHGGFGGLNPPGFGVAHGSIIAPFSSGGSSGSRDLSGGKGGGIVRLIVNKNFVLDGTVSSDGSTGSFGTSGSAGGSVWLNVGNLSGSGRISANGSDGTGQSGGGSGGRIALYCATNQFSGAVTASGGNGLARGGAGTIYTKQDSAAVGHLLISNGGLVGTNTPLSAAYSYPTGAFDLTIDSAAVVHFAGTPPLLSNLFIDQDAMLTHAGPVQTSNTTIAVLGDLTIRSNASLSFDAKGYPRGSGPGAGSSLVSQGAGGSHGGTGGASASGASSGTNYDSATEPAVPGSGGGIGFGPVTTGSEGGGAIRVMVGKSLLVDGLLSAKGADGIQDNSGGGSGGSIWITAASLNGAGVISADGGNGEFFNGGGGGGGRIAFYTGTNNFTGAASAHGGWGAGSGADGTIYFAGLSAAPIVWGQMPSDLVTNPVSSIDLIFSSAINPATISTADAWVQTPTMVIPESSMSVAMVTPTTLRISFPQQTTVGDYQFHAGPDIEDLWGHSMSPIYTGAFTVVLPTIEGLVTDTNGLPVAGVLMQPSGDQSAAVTDSNGLYSVGVVYGWSGSLTPLLSGSMFVPGARSYTNVTNTVAEQNFRLVPTIAPAMSATADGTNFWLRWPGIQGVIYQLESSTNMVNWTPYGEAIAVTNGVVEVLAPI